MEEDEEFDAPADDDIDFLRVTHDAVSVREGEQVSSGKNRDGSLERGWGLSILSRGFYVVLEMAVISRPPLEFPRGHSRSHGPSHNGCDTHKQECQVDGGTEDGLAQNHPGRRPHAVMGTVLGA